MCMVLIRTFGADVDIALSIICAEHWNDKGIRWDCLWRGQQRCLNRIERLLHVQQESNKTLRELVGRAARQNEHKREHLPVCLHHVNQLSCWSLRVSFNKGERRHSFNNSSERYLSMLVFLHGIQAFETATTHPVSQARKGHDHLNTNSSKQSFWL